MAKKDNFFGKESEIVEDSFFGDDAEIVEDEMGQLEAAARGAAQGLTFDFADEIAGGIQAGVGALQGEGDLEDLYKKYRDEQKTKP